MKPPNSATPRRSTLAAAWFLPSATLLLMPKCPMCVAAYVTMFTGLSLSFSAASALQTMLMAGCAIMLGLLAVVHTRRWLASRGMGKSAACPCAKRPAR